MHTIHQIIQSKLTPIRSRAVTERTFTDVVPASVHRSYATIRGEIGQGVVGLDAVLDGIAQDIFWKTSGQSRTGPESVYLFCGPSGSGKSLIAQHRLNAAQGKDRAIKVFEMASYAAENDGFGLIGLRKGYASARAGDLTAFVRQHPNAILVFENFHRAHPRVQSILESILTNGELQDQYEAMDIGNALLSGQRQGVVNFKRTIVVFTTQLGSEIYSNQTLYKRLRATLSRLNKSMFDAIARAVDDRGHQYVPPGLVHALESARTFVFEPLAWADQVELVMAALKKHAQHCELRGLYLVIPHPRSIAETLLLGVGQRLHPGHFDALVRDFSGRCIAGLNLDTDCPEHIHISLEGLAVEKLTQWISDLADDPLAAMELRRESLLFELDFDCASGTVNHKSVLIKGLNFQKDTSWTDFGQGWGLRVEMPTKRYDDIAGLDGVKKQLQGAIHTLRHRQALQKAEVSAPRGVLLWGPPGTAKTTLAKAMANESGLPFIGITGPDLLQPGFSKRVFTVARKHQPSIVFIDEIDALGRRGQGGHDVAINQLLSEIDGMDAEADSSVFVVAATNFPQKVDEALLRSGRIECHIEIPVMDAHGRTVYLNRFAAHANLTAGDMSYLVDLSAGMTGADMERCLRQIIVKSSTATPNELAVEQVADAIRDVRFGEIAPGGEPSMPDMLQLAAVHEVGHAITGMVLNPIRNLLELSIEPRKSAGRCMFKSSPEAHTVSYVRAEIACLLGGRVAETLQFGEAGVDAGSRSDFESATALARRAIAEWGMDDEIGPLNIGALQTTGAISGEMLYRIETRVMHWLSEASALATRVLAANAIAMDHLSKLLLEKQRLSGPEVNALFAMLDLELVFNNHSKRCDL